MIVRCGTVLFETALISTPFGSSAIWHPRTVCAPFTMNGAAEPSGLSNPCWAFGYSVS